MSPLFAMAGAGEALFATDLPDLASLLIILPEETSPPSAMALRGATLPLQTVATSDETGASSEKVPPDAAKESRVDASDSKNTINTQAIFLLIAVTCNCTNNLCIDISTPAIIADFDCQDEPAVALPNISFRLHHSYRIKCCDDLLIFYLCKLARVFHRLSNPNQ